MNVPTDLESFRAHVRDFIAREVIPNAETWMKQRAVSRGLHAAAGEWGLLGLKYPQALGGSDRAYSFTEVLLDEYGRSSYMGSLLSLVLQSEFSTPHLALYGSPSIQKRFLSPAIAGKAIISIAMTEPEGGSDLAGLKTTAVPVEGGYKVNGAKWMIGNASLADAVLVICNSPAEEGEWSQMTMLAVETSRPGFRMVRQLEKIGLHATPNCELRFEDCFVPEENVVGKPGLALPQLMKANCYERVAIAVMALASMRAAWEHAVRFLSGRMSGGVPLVDRSPWRHQLTEDYMQMEGCQRVVKDAAATLATGKPDQAQVLTAKVLATETSVRVISRAQQAHGARGFLYEEPIGRLAMDARALTIGGGASEIMMDALSRIVLPKALKGRP